MRDFPAQVGPGGEPVSDSASFTSSNANDVIQEHQNAVKSSGQTLVPLIDPADNTQVSQAMARYASGGIFGVDSGAADAYVVSSTGTFTVPNAYFDGMTIHFRPANANTGASTVNAFGIGDVDLVAQDGSGLAADAVNTTEDAIARFDSSSGDFIVLSQAADPGGPTLGTPVATTSGTSIDFTSIPSGTQRIVVMLSGVSSNGSSRFTVRIGDSGGIEATGYQASVGSLTNSDFSSIGFSVFRSTGTSAGFAWNAVMILEKINNSTNTWVMQCNSGGITATEDPAHVAGSKSLSAELDRVRLTTEGGTDTFDAGEINISYE